MIGALADAPNVWTDRRFLRCALLLWIACSAVYFLTAPGRLDLVDGAVRYEVTDNLLSTGKPIVTTPWLFAVPGRWGERYAVYPWGASVAALPFVYIGGLLSSGSIETKRFVFSLTSVPYAAGTVALLFLIYGRLGLRLGRALRWSLVVAFATMLWPYAGSSFDQALHCFWLTLAVWSAVEALAARSVRWALLSALGFFALTTQQEAYCVLPFGLLLGAARKLSIPELFRALGRREWVVSFCGVGLGMLSLFAYNDMRFGSATMGGRFQVPHPIFGNPLVGLSGLLASPGKSIFLYSPPYVLALLGLYRLARERPAIARAIACICALQLGLIIHLAFWAGEWAWGPRYLVATLGLVAIGLPFATPPRTRRPLKLTLCGLGALVQLLALSVDHQIFYVERSFQPYFWLDRSIPWIDSPLLARPAEMVRVFSGDGIAKAEALVPGPEPLSMTSCIFGPQAYAFGNPRAWMDKYLVFQVPRPWTLWAPLLPPDARPASPLLLGLLGLGAALVSFALLGLAVRRDETRTDC